VHPCDPREANVTNDPTSPSDITLIAGRPLTDCDPWLTNFQKILTDGDPDGDGKFNEVVFQSPLPAIVKLETRVADQRTMAPLAPAGTPGDTATFRYIFNIGAFRGETVRVNAVLHFRHLSPYFVTGLDGLYPPGITAAALLKNLTVVNMSRAASPPVKIPGAAPPPVTGVVFRAGRM
jgi:hypothetical protein